MIDDQGSPDYRQRFELLSAYLDGEVSHQERRLVEDWLRCDRQSQSLYQQLLQLRSGLHRPYPTDGTTPWGETLDQVLWQLRQQRQTWMRRSLVLFVTSVLGMGWWINHARTQSPLAKQAERAPSPLLSSSQNINDIAPSALLVALEAPPIDIPIVNSKKEDWDKRGR